MVESIYGGGKVLPHFHERGSLLLQRRFSTGASSLQPISEVNSVEIGGQDRSEAADRTFLFVESTVAEHMPTRRPRAHSLPAIYRDGSYLRIELPDEARLRVSQNRRFSEPEVAASSVPHGQIPSTVCPRETKLLSFSPSPAAFEAPFERSVAEHEELRRPLEPAAHARKQRLAELEGIRTRNSGNVGNLVNTRNLCTEGRGSQNKFVANSGIAFSGRKFSLPPMPRNGVVHRAKSTVSLERRRRSYPLSKADFDRLAQKLPEIVSSGARDTSNETPSNSDGACEDGLDDVGAADETGAHMNISVDILTRWMKFFG